MAETADAPVGYMERTRLYYRALGYDGDYVWSQYDDVPFATLAKPLDEAKIALVTTASAPGPREHRCIRSQERVVGRCRRAAGRARHRQRRVGQRLHPHAGSGELSADLYDQRSRSRWCGRRSHQPLPRRADRRIQPEQDNRTGCARDLAAHSRGRCRRRCPDAVMTGLPPNREFGCPTPRSRRPADCHHRLGARHRRALRRAALCVFGLSAGQPLRPSVARRYAAQRSQPSALELLGEASAPRTTVHSPFTWWDERDWRSRYNRVEPSDRARLLALGEDRRKRQAAAKHLRENSVTA